MKIAFIVDKIAPEYTGGYEERVWSFALGLARSHEVRVYTALTTPGSTGQQNPRKMRCGPYLARRRVTSRSVSHSVLYSLGLLSNPFGKWSPDAVVVEAIPYLHLYSMRRWIDSLSCAKLLDVVEAWARYLPGRGLLAGPSLGLIRSLLALGLAWSDMAIVAASPTAISLSKHYGFDRTRVIPTGVELPKSESRHEGVAAEDLYDFATLGRLVPDKRQSDFIEALGILRATGWNGRAVVIGDGPSLSRLQVLAREADLDSRIDFPGRVSHKEKFELLNNSRIFVLCSEREGQSISTLEALACGLPAIVAQPAYEEVFGVSDLVTDRVNGLCYPAGETRALARCMRLLLDDPESRRRYSEAATLAAGRYNWDTVIGDLEATIMATVSAR
ncbi:MAG TPA: glycosyltransferase family 4 protein [Thermoplasmata archaeon]|nr:glycosyltransferase family 4 protein [Thermoplasmata archaeon]